MTFIFYSAVIGCDEVAVATDRQRHEDQEYSSPRAHCKFNDPGIYVFVFALILTMVQVFLYLCLCLILQLSRTRPWWRLSISWWRLRTRTSWTTPRAPRRPNSRVSLIKLLAATISGGVGFGHSGHVMTVENRQFRRIFVSIEKSYYGIIPVVKIKNI